MRNNMTKLSRSQRDRIYKYMCCKFLLEKHPEVMSDDYIIRSLLSSEYILITKDINSFIQEKLGISKERFMLETNEMFTKIIDEYKQWKKINNGKKNLSVRK